MSKAIRILSIVALAIDLIYILVGRILAPGFAFCQQVYSIYFSLDRWTQCMPAITLYVVVSMLTGISILIMWIYAIIMIAKAGSDSSKIGLEIAGYVLMLVVAPIIVGAVSFVATYMGAIVFLHSGIYAAIYSAMTSASTVFGPLHSVAFSLLMIAMALSIGRKKYENTHIESED